MQKTHLVVCWLAALFCFLLVGPGAVRASPIAAIEQTDITAPFWGPEEETDTSALETPRHSSVGSAWSLMRPASSDAQRIVAGTHLRLDTMQLAQAAEKKSVEAATPAAAETESKSESKTEINKQLSNPVTSFWSLEFQFNNYNLENDHWNHNLLFQPVLPVSLTEDWSLINRPVIPVYQSVPHPIGHGRFRQTTGFGDVADVELLSPAHAGGWLLGLGPTFIFPTGSTYTSQHTYQIGPAGVFGYLSKHYIIGLFPQQWWSVSGGSRPPVSQLNLQPFASYFLPDGWSVGYSGNVLANERASNDEMWTVPIGLALSKVEFLGKLPVKFQVAGQYMPEHPSEFGQKWNVQINITPVIPKLLKGSIF